MSTAALPIVTTNQDYPHCLTDRFGEWSAPPKLSEAAKELLNKFIGAFGSAPWPYKLGDPRSLMGSNETSFLVVKDGRFGMLTEIELSITTEGAGAGAGEWVSDAEFATHTQEWHDRLMELVPLYPQSEFFLAHGQPTFDGRLCLNAFTPITVGWGCHCEDPYRQHGKSLERLDEAMSAIAWAMPCVLEYDHHGVDGDVVVGQKTKARIYMGSAHRRIITEHFLDGEIAAGDVVPTGVLYGNKRFDVACNGDEITAVGEGHAIADHPSTKGAPKP